MTSPLESIGSATRIVQNYPTQLWHPQSPRAKAEGHFAIIHDRRGCDEQRGIFFMPGNAKKKLEENPITVDVRNDEGSLQTLHIPAVLLWDFHGGPCTRGASRYRQIGAEVMDRIYSNLEYGKLSALSDEKERYIGPFDRVLWPDSHDVAKYSPMDPRLFDR